MSTLEATIGAAVGKAKAGAVLSEITGSIGIREVSELKVCDCLSSIHALSRKTINSMISLNHRE